MDETSSMSDNDSRVVRRSKLIHAEPEVIFELLADPAKHPELDGSGSVQKARGNPERLSLGATFGMDMKIGLPYRITNEVVEFTEDRRIAWRHFGGHIWRWILEPVEGDTQVTEEFEWGTSKAPFVLKLIQAPKRNAAAIEATLDRLEKRYAPTP